MKNFKIIFKSNNNIISFDNVSQNDTDDIISSFEKQNIINISDKKTGKMVYINSILIESMGIEEMK